MWEVGAGVLAFAVLFLFLPEVVRTEAGTPSSVLVALAPLVPVLWIAIAVARHVQRVDEFQRSFILRSFASGFGAAMVIALTVAFLSTAGVTVSNPEWYVFIGGMTAWGVALGVLSFRAGR